MNFTFEYLSVTPITDKCTISYEEFEKIKNELKMTFSGSYIRHNMYDYYSEKFAKCVITELNLSIDDGM